MTNAEHEVPLARLRERLNPDELGFETTAEVPPIEGILGQDRALRALEFGLHVDTNGYHLYAAGLPGTGKMTAIESSLATVRGKRPKPEDWCYVHNFEEPDQPRAIALPAGKGAQLAHDMQHLIEAAKEAIPGAFQSEDYARRRAEAVREFEERSEQMSRQVEEKARRQGFAIEATAVGIVTAPLVDGRPLAKEEFNRLPEEKRRILQQQGEQLQEQLEQALRRGRALEHEARARVEQLDREIARIAVGPPLDELHQKYADLPQVVDYLERVRGDIPDHLGDFRRPEAEDREAFLAALLREDHLVRYRVNLFVDNSHTQGAPVLVEHQPTYYNLFGRIDYRSRLGGMVTDCTMIKAGAIHRANGGYLVLQARDVLTSLASWETLKRTLRSGEARIENLGEQYSAIPTATIRPKPIPIELKVVLVGPPLLYDLLNTFDEDFRRLFGVRADFDVDMDRSKDHVALYAGFLSSLSHRENLKPFHKGAVAGIIDFAARTAGHQQRLSARFLELARLAREASFWASRNGNSAVMAEDVEKAIAEHEYRASSLEERLRRQVLEQTVRIDTEGTVPAQVNGLSVVDLGDHAFGRPACITARTAPGTQGVVNIEREIELSGRIHSKGVLILAGYLAGKYAQDEPLALSASLTFEQTYDEVEGDSASSAELYALISSLSGLPLKQGIAVTGAVNQRGQIQAVGGVNEKIEGFFRICKERGLSGEQGVIIPQDNVKHLMLKDEVVEAVRDGKFHVWGVQSVDQGIELLTGVPAGERRADGSYPPGTVNCLVDHRLKVFAERLKEFRPASVGGQIALVHQRGGREAAQHRRQRAYLGGYRGLRYSHRQRCWWRRP